LFIKGSVVVADDLVCLNCGHHLRIAADAEESWLSCPRCLAVIANPRRSAVATRPSSPAEGAFSPAVCPGCGEPVQPSWRYCPLCNARCGPTPGLQPLPLPDVEVRRDSKGAVLCLVVIGVLVLIGVGLFAASGGFAVVSASKAGPAILLLGLVVLVVIGAGTGILLFGSKSPTTKVVSGVLGGLAAAATVALVFVLIILAAIAAVFVSILETCGKCGR
jgi:hypothetical protein